MRNFHFCPLLDKNGKFTSQPPKAAQILESDSHCTKLCYSVDEHQCERPTESPSSCHAVLGEKLSSVDVI